MNTNKKTERNLVDVRIILSALWAARMLSSLQGDSTRFHDPVMLRQLVSGTSEITVTNELLLVMSIIMAVPIFMSFLSLTLPYKANRWANLSIGIFFVAFEIGFLIFVYLPGAVYEVFWGFAYLVFAALVVWYAWKWPKQEA
jgi:heme A synthase